METFIYGLGAQTRMFLDVPSGCTMKTEFETQAFNELGPRFLSKSTTKKTFLT